MDDAPNSDSDDVELDYPCKNFEGGGGNFGGFYGWFFEWVFEWLLSSKGIFHYRCIFLVF